MNAEEIVRRFNKSKSYRQNWENLYSSAYEHFMPQRSNSFKDFSSHGQNNDGKGVVYDSAPLDALNRFVSKLQTSLVPAQKNWIRLKVGTAITNNVEQLQRVLDNITNVLFDCLRSSSFDVAAAESFYDLGIGTGCLMMTEGTINSPFKIRTVPLSELYLENIGNSQIGGVFRKHKVMPSKAKEFWSDVKLTKDMSEEEKIQDFIEYTVEEKGKFKYYVVYMKTKEVVVEETLDYNPFIIFRWTVMPGEVYGRGTVLFALPDAKSLNKTKELILKNGSIAVSGIYTCEDDGTVNPGNVKFVPGSIIPVGSNGGSSRSATLQALNTGTDFNVGDMIIKDLRQSIYAMLFANPMGAIDLPVKTATEIEYRQKEYAETIGAPFGRLQTELIAPIIKNGLIILDKLDKIDIADFKVNGQDIAIEYSSPLTLSQNTEEVNKMTSFLSMITQVFGAEVASQIVKTTLIPKLASKMGVDTNDISSSEELEELKEKVAQNVQQQQQQQNELDVMNAKAQSGM